MVLDFRFLKLRHNDFKILLSILYNREVYPAESFVKVKKYGLPMLLTQDEGVKSFIANLTAQLSGKFFNLYIGTSGFAVSNPVFLFLR